MRPCDKVFYALIIVLLAVAPVYAQVSFNAGGVNGGAVIVGEADALDCPGSSNENLGAIRFVASGSSMEACISTGWHTMGP